MLFPAIGAGGILNSLPRRIGAGIGTPKSTGAQRRVTPAFLCTSVRFMAGGKAAFTRAGFLYSGSSNLVHPPPSRHWNSVDGLKKQELTMTNETTTAQPATLNPESKTTPQNTLSGDLVGDRSGRCNGGPIGEGGAQGDSEALNAARLAEGAQLVGWRFTESGPLAILDPGNGERGLILAAATIKASPTLWGRLSPKDRAELELGPLPRLEHCR